MSLITTKPTIYLVNLTMKDYVRQKSKYLPLIAKWVVEHGGVPRDIIPFSVEFEEKTFALKEEPEKLLEFLKEFKVKSKLEKIITEGFTKLGLQYYFTGMFPHWIFYDSDTKSEINSLVPTSRRERNPLLDNPKRIASTASRYLILLNLLS